jgi:hypothetical protein
MPECKMLGMQWESVNPLQGAAESMQTRSSAYALVLVPLPSPWLANPPGSQVPSCLRLVEPLQLATRKVELTAGDTLPETTLSVLNGAGVKMIKAQFAGERAPVVVTQRLWRLVDGTPQQSGHGTLQFWCTCLQHGASAGLFAL